MCAAQCDPAFIDFGIFGGFASIGCRDLEDFAGLASLQKFVTGKLLADVSDGASTAFSESIIDMHSPLRYRKNLGNHAFPQSR
jgi:hypothetical protein